MYLVGLAVLGGGEDAYAASEVEATMDGMAAENAQPPDDIATARGNAVYFWNGSEPPAAEDVDVIVDCLR